MSYFGGFIQQIRVQTATTKIALVLLAVVAAQAAAATRHTQSGVVVRVVDGDTLWLKTSTAALPLKLRIQGIDAPEICQLGGLLARDALKVKVWGQRVTVTLSAHDQYGRAVGTVHMQDQDIGRWMVVQGHAWVYSYRSKKAPYSAEFSEAQEQRRGMFSTAAIEEPRIFRKRHGSCQAR